MAVVLRETQDNFHFPNELTSKELTKAMNEITRNSARKIWRRPELQKLPIAATAGDANKDLGNEGGGAGKGDSGDPPIS